MALTEYCSGDEVRAALGVNSTELPDTVLDLPVYKIGLVRELTKVSTSLPAAFSAVSIIAEESRTDPQQALYDAVHLFCVYAAARQVGVSLGAMAPKDVGDGKATLSRFSDSPYKDVLDRVEAMYVSTRDSVQAALDAYAGSSSATPSTTPFTAFLASGRSVDPVTGS